MNYAHLLLSACCLGITLHARTPDLPPQRPLPALPQKAAAQTPTFEIQNKYPKTIWITIFSNGKSVTGGLTHPIAGFKKDSNDIPSFHNKVIDISKPTYIAVWTQEPPQLPWIYNEADSRVFFSTTPTKLYTFKNGKTLYLTWDESGLRPQTGKLKGLAGETEGGFSLSNNVNSNELVEVPYVPQTGILFN